MIPNLRSSSQQSQQPTSQQVANYHHHPNQQTQNINIGVDPLNKLYCSLLCGLKNEMDFGLRVATLLANSKEAEWISDFKFIDVLIESCQLYSCCCDDEDNEIGKDEEYFFSKDKDRAKHADQTASTKSKERDVNSHILKPKKGNAFEIVILEKNCHCLQKFWSGLSVDKSTVDLAFSSENYGQGKQENIAPSDNSERNGDHNDCSAESVFETDSFDMCDDDTVEDMETDCQALLNIKKHKPNNQKRIHDIVKSVSEIIRNLSFNIEQQDKDKSFVEMDDGTVVPYSAGYNYNCVTLKLMKFLVLLLSCKDQYFKNIGLDILSNIASMINVNSGNAQYVKCLEIVNRYSIDTIMSSNDITAINRCLEIVSKMIPKYCDQSTENLHSHLLDQELLRRLTELLTCQHDILLVVSCLECFRTISEYCPELLINESLYLLNILLALLNCDASQYFTKSALTRIKVIDERQKILADSSSKAITVGQKSSVILDNETFINLWLKSNYEVKPSAGKNASLKLTDLYEEYVKHCVRCGRKNLLGNPSFSVLVKKCFPSCTIVNGTSVEGLCHKSIPSGMQIRITGGTGVASPILKAHLSSPPKSNAVCTISATTSSSSAVASTTSTLIKNLLANKLRTGASGQHGISSLNCNSSSITFSSLNTGSVTVTPATTISSGTYNSSSNSSSSKTTTTIIPCSINNLNLNSLKFNQQKSSSGPSSPTFDKPSTSTAASFSSSTLLSNKTQTTMEMNLMINAIQTSVITSVSSVSTVSNGSTTCSIVTKPTNITVTSTTIPTDVVNSHTNSKDLSTNMIVTPAITSTPVLVTSGESVNTQSVIVSPEQTPSSTLSSLPTIPSTLAPTSVSTIVQATPSALLSTNQSSIQGNSVLISTSQSGNNVQSNQPQQFLLVRTIIGNQQQTGLVGVPNTGQPMRLILNPNFLQRGTLNSQQSNVTVNGIASSASLADSGAITTRPGQTAYPNQTTKVLTVSTLAGALHNNSTNATTVTSSSNISSTSSSTSDILLKAVLGSGIVGDSSSLSNSSTTTSVTSQNNSIRTSNVKSSPLLNVLLDKGKLPDFSTMAGTNNQLNPGSAFNPSICSSVVTSSSSLVSSNSTPATKMYILTTNSPLPIKNLSSIQAPASQVSNIGVVTTSSNFSSSVTSLPSASNVCKPQPQPIIVASSQQSLPIQPQVQTVPLVNTTSEGIKINNTTTTVTLCPNPASASQQTCVVEPPQATARRGSVSKGVQLESCDESSNMSEEVKLKDSILIEGLRNGQLFIDPVPVIPPKVTSGVNSDLSSIRDIYKTVDDATKLISKRSNDELSPVINASKKAKLTANINSVCVTAVKSGSVKNMSHLDSSLVTCDKLIQNDSTVGQSISAEKTLIQNSSPSPSPSLSSSPSSSSLSSSSSSCNTASIIIPTSTSSFIVDRPINSCAVKGNAGDTMAPSNTSASSTISTENSNSASAVTKTSVTTNLTMTDSATTLSSACQATANGITLTTIKSKSSISSTSIKSNASDPSKTVEYMCEWHGCKRLFARPAQVYWHVHKEHVDIYDESLEQMTCHWGGPEGLGPGCKSSRPKLSLLTHIHDFHCNPTALQQAALRREQAGTTPSNITPIIIPPAHPGYAANAALLAIRRHAVNYVEPIKPPPVTPYTPISVSIRITAALILRNLAETSHHVRTILQSYEPYLSELCFSEGRDESRTIAQCLSNLVDKSER